MQGIVKWFNNERGFGFINIENEKKDIFVHYSQIISLGYKTLKSGEKVEFELLNSEKGPQAINVSRLSKGN